MQAVVSGAVTLQRHLAAAGLVDSPTCPFCDSGEAETEEHAFWQCPAWAHVRRRWLGADQVDLSGFPKITQSCAVVTRSVQDQQLSTRFLDVAPLRGPLPPTDGQQDDTHSYGRRVGYTDGSCMGTKREHAVRRAGYGLAWGKDHPHNMAEPLRGPWQSSQRAELTAAVQMTLAEPSEPLLIRTDSAWTMAGGLLLLEGYRPDARWESGDLWRQWAQAINNRAPTCQVFLQKVKAHVDESHFA